MMCSMSSFALVIRIMPLGERGIARIAPFGSALNLGAIGDGYDLPREFTRLATLQT